MLKLIFKAIQTLFFKAIVCDEGSSLVRLLGQLGSNEKIVDQHDDIIEILYDNELEIPITEVDFTLSNVQNQIQEIESELKSSKMNNLLRLSVNENYSNSILPDLNVQTEDEDIYNLENLEEIDGRRVETLKNLEIKLGKKN